MLFNNLEKWLIIGQESRWKFPGLFSSLISMK